MNIKTFWGWQQHGNIKSTVHQFPFNHGHHGVSKRKPIISCSFVKLRRNIPVYITHKNIGNYFILGKIDTYLCSVYFTFDVSHLNNNSYYTVLVDLKIDRSFGGGHYTEKSGNLINRGVGGACHLPTRLLRPLPWYCYPQNVTQMKVIINQNASFLLSVPIVRESKRTHLKKSTTFTSTHSSPEIFQPQYQKS